MPPALALLLLNPHPVTRRVVVSLALVSSGDPVALVVVAPIRIILGPVVVLEDHDADSQRDEERTRGDEPDASLAGGPDGGFGRRRDRGGVVAVGAARGRPRERRDGRALPHSAGDHQLRAGKDDVVVASERGGVDALEVVKAHAVLVRDVPKVIVPLHGVHAGGRASAASTHRALDTNGGASRHRHAAHLNLGRERLPERLSENCVVVGRVVSG